MNIKKYLMLGGVALTMGLFTASCVGDLDLEPNDPNLEADTPQRLINSAMACYSGLAVSGQEGPGSSIISGLDNGRGQYTRALFMMNEFPTDECIWIWKDDGIYDLVTNTFDNTNGNIYGTYSRLYAHIATCNKFLADSEGNTEPEILKLRAEVRALRALSYYWVIDIFGRGSFAIDNPDGQTDPRQAERKELFKFVENELKEIVDGNQLDQTPAYGRVGIDGAEALLARLYLNAQVYMKADAEWLANNDSWALCSARCENIIRRHLGGGYQGSGLAEHYLYLFCRNNDEYMPGGGNVAENEILWGIPFDADRIQSYGGTMLLINGALADELGMSGLAYGCSNTWKCMKATEQFSKHFTGESNDVRWQHWVKGKRPYTASDGSQKEKEYKISNDEFGAWGDGYVCIKWTGLTHTTGGNWDSNIISTQFPSTDLGLIRLSDVYLMYVESFVQGNAGNLADAVKYVNYVRGRAGVSTWSAADLTADNILAERCRELYWELTRRSDLVRFGKFTGPDQMLWAWKGNALEGNNIDSRYDIMPIPANILSASPDFKQNPGYPGGVAY